MSQFLEYLNDNLIAESFIDTIEKDEIDSLVEGLNESEEILNEFLGLGKLAKKVGAFSEKADKKADEVKEKVKSAVEKGKETVEKAAYAGKEIGKDIKQTVAGVAETNKDFAKATKKAFDAKKEEVKEKFVKLSGAAKDVLKQWHEKIGELNDSQKQTLAELDPLYTKLKEGKSVGGPEAIKILSVVLAGVAEGGKYPSYKAYTKQLEKLRTLPGISSFRFTVKTAK